MGLGVAYYLRINKIYKVGDKIGNGSISEVYQVKDRDGIQRAAKFVLRRYRFFLAIENKVMQESNASNNNGIPRPYFFGRHGNKYVLVMDLLGDTLSVLRQRRGTFSLKSGLLAGIQITSRLQSIHELGFIHQNISPDSFLIGRASHERKLIFLTNFENVMKFRDNDGNHRLPTWGLSFQGSKGFASRYAHRGERQSRRCDLESAAYLIIYLIKGLPWDNLSSNVLVGTGNMKEEISAEELCGDLPWEIMSFYRDIRGLSYDECPNYSALRGYLLCALDRNAHGLDTDFE